MKFSSKKPSLNCIQVADDTDQCTYDVYIIYAKKKLAELGGISRRSKTLLIKLR